MSLPRVMCQTSLGQISVGLYLGAPVVYDPRRSEQPRSAIAARAAASITTSADDSTGSPASARPVAAVGGRP